MNVHLFDVLSAILPRKVSEKSGIFFCLESGHPISIG